MKKKLFLVSFMVMLLACVLAISVGATAIDKGTTVTLNSSFTDVNGNTVTSVNLYDSDGDALIWYVNTDGRLVSAKAASIVTVDEEGVISFSDKKIFQNNQPEKSVVVVNLRDNVKVTGTSVNFDGKIKHFDVEKGLSTGVDIASTGFQFGSYNLSGSKMEYFYFPTSTQSITKRMFQSSPVQVADFEPGTELTQMGLLAFYGAKSLKTIYIPNGVEVITSVSGGQGMFQNCSALSSVVFEENSQLWDAGHNTFQSCSSLKELYLPNSVKTIGSEFARGSGIEIFSFGASFEYFTKRAEGDPDNNHIWVFYAAPLKKVYMPATFALLGDKYDHNDYASADERLDEFDRAFSNAGSFTLFLTGTEEQMQALKTRISYTQENQSLVNSLKTIYSYEDYLKAGSPTGSMAVYGCNVCDTFYDGAHNNDTDCTTADACKNGCGLVNPKTAGHSNKQSLSFDGGLTADGLLCTECQNVGCTVKTKATVPAIFTAKGYSTNPEKNAINGGYTVNLDSLALYKRFYGNITYGVVIANANSFDGEFFDKDNNVNTAKAVQAEIDHQYSNFDCSISFGTNTGVDLNLVICAYVITDDGVVFIQKDSGSDVTIGGAAFKSVTLAQVIALVPAVSKEN